MNNKFILIGGYLHKAKDGGKAFCDELTKDLKMSRPVNIFDCMFARPEDSWVEKFDDDKIFFSKFINNFELELAQVEKFVDQVKNSDVIFVRGGDTDVLMEVLNKTGDWIKELEGKVFAGTSAGAEVLSKYSYNLDTLKVSEYLGLLPIKFIPHFNSDYNSPNINWKEVVLELKNYKENLPMYLVAEGEFVVLNK
jgi:peptidase E